MTRPGALLVCLALAACDGAPPPVVVYLYGDDSTPLAARLDAFTAETGIPVEVRFGASRVLADDVIANRGSPPADVLLTSNAADIWRAAEEGALRPIASDAFDAIADVQKDPDRYWAGIRVHLHFIASKSTAVTVATYDELGTAAFAGRLCLSSSALPVNRSLIAQLIEERGVREAERLVRRWSRNLAHAPFANEDELLDAIRDGRCEFGITSSHGRLEGLMVYSIPPHYFDVSAVGVGRHAGQPDAAQRFVGWLLRGQVDSFKGDVDLRPASVAGWRDEEARLLAERASYR